MTESAGQFTVKEMLTQIVIPDLKVIKASLDNKADRSELTSVEARIAHFEAAEASYVKRTGPVMDEIRAHNIRIDDLEKESIRRGAVVDRYFTTEKMVQENSQKLAALPGLIRQEIETALSKYDKQVEAEGDRKFSRRDRLFLIFAALVGVVATIISTVYLVINTGGN